MLKDLWQDWFSVPEAERLDAREYARLVERAKLRRGDAAWVVPMLAAFGVFVAWVVLASVGAAVVAGTWGTPGLGSGPPAPGGGLATAFGCGTFVAGGLLAAAVYAGLRWVLLVRSIRREVNKAGCPSCDFSLVGLKVEDGAVDCPECGAHVVLADHKLFPEDLKTEAQRRGPKPGAGPMGAYKGPRRGR